MEFKALIRWYLTALEDIHTACSVVDKSVIILVTMLMLQTSCNGSDIVCTEQVVNLHKVYGTLERITTRYLEMGRDSLLNSLISTITCTNGKTLN